VLLVLRTDLNNSEIRYTKKLCIFQTGGVYTPYSPCMSTPLDAGADVAAVGCADPSLSAGATLLRRDGDIATVTCNSTGAVVSDSAVWTVRCVSGSWHGLSAVNCSTGSDTSSSRIHTRVTAGDGADQTSWSVGQFFPLDSFPYSQSPTLTLSLCL